jgi:hypothetical protein
MCTEPVCLEGVDFQPRGAVIQVGHAYLDGHLFAVLIRDSRYEGLKHLRCRRTRCSVTAC